MRLNEVTTLRVPQRLFHGTSIMSAATILSQDMLRDDIGSDEHHSGVSFTSSVAIAKRFARWSEQMSEEGFGLPRKRLFTGAVLVLSGPMVERKTGLTRIRWQGASEREFRSRGPVNGVAGCLLEVRANLEEIDWHLTQLEDLTEKEHVSLTELMFHPQRREAGPPGDA